MKRCRNEGHSARQALKTFTSFIEDTDGGANQRAVERDITPDESVTRFEIVHSAPADFSTPGFGRQGGVTVTAAGGPLHRDADV